MPTKSRRYPKRKPIQRAVRVMRVVAAPPVSMRPQVHSCIDGSPYEVIAHDLRSFKLEQVTPSHWTMKLTGRDGFVLDITLSSPHKAKIDAVVQDA